jgi:hypothetical protein
MPPRREEEPSVLGWLFLIFFWAALWPILIVLYVANRRRLCRLASERAGEDIGTFARAFDQRSEPFDPWVVRATWDALGPYWTLDGQHLPLRPADRLLEDLGVDPDDLVLDLFPEVARRAGRSLDAPELNPYFGQLYTVGDFVRYLTLQPKASVEA